MTNSVVVTDEDVERTCGACVLSLLLGAEEDTLPGVASVVQLPCEAFKVAKRLVGVAGRVQCFRHGRVVFTSEGLTGKWKDPAYWYYLRHRSVARSTRSAREGLR